MVEAKCDEVFRDGDVTMSIDGNSDSDFDDNYYSMMRLYSPHDKPLEKDFHNDDFHLMDRKEGLPYLLSNLPQECKDKSKIIVLLWEELKLVPSQFTIGDTLPRGDVLLWLHPEAAIGFEYTHRLDNTGTLLKKLNNRREEAAHCIIVYGVPVPLDLVNFENKFGNELVPNGARRYNYKGTSNPSLIVELKFHNKDVAESYLAKGSIEAGFQSFKIAPKYITNAPICRVCKKINPGHSPSKCEQIRCEICSGSHATKDHPENHEVVSCPECHGPHRFRECPELRKVYQDKQKKQRKTYKEVVMRNKKRFEVESTVPKRVNTPLPTTQEELCVFMDFPAQKAFKQLLKEYIAQEVKAQLQERWNRFNESTDSLRVNTQQSQEREPEFEFKEAQTGKRKEKIVHSNEELSAKRDKTPGYAERNRTCNKGCGLKTTPGPMTIHEKSCDGISQSEKYKEKGDKARSIKGQMHQKISSEALARQQKLSFVPTHQSHHD